MTCWICIRLCQRNWVKNRKRKILFQVEFVQCMVWQPNRVPWNIQIGIGPASPSKFFQYITNWHESIEMTSVKMTSLVRKKCYAFRIIFTACENRKTNMSYRSHFRSFVERINLNHSGAKTIVKLKLCLRKYNEMEMSNVKKCVTDMQRMPNKVLFFLTSIDPRKIFLFVYFCVSFFLISQYSTV